MAHETNDDVPSIKLNDYAYEACIVVLLLVEIWFLVRRVWGS